MLYDWSMESNYVTNGGSKIVVYARVGGANTTPLFSAAHFAKQNTKFGGSESEGETGIHFPQTPFSARLARSLGWEATRPCASKEAKPAKIVSLFEKIFCARPLKEKEIFAGFACRRQSASRWAGFLPVRAEIVARKRFERRSVIATKCNFADFQTRSCIWSGMRDLNPRPPAPKAGALANCANPRKLYKQPITKKQ